ncbi:hypothetical protein GCM10025867_17270 [Frondihabitans sucicola]|uniref:Uncharacterized protein n=1 Tax=Frondihabitans sucicola TaxID=1268041 RepID=A0ABM8GM41_9MICO|nr:hypothetical protein GCM10025867_17270 [Frondihabitans sucicola]
MDDDLGAVRRPPDEQLGNVGERRDGVHAQVEIADARPGEERDETDRVTGNVGHLGGDPGGSEAFVEALRDRQRVLDEGPVHELRVRRAGEGVPDDPAARDRLLHPRHSVRVGSIEKGLHEPGSRRPDERGVGRLGELLGQVEGTRDPVLDVLVEYGVRAPREPQIEMRLEDDVDRLDHGVVTSRRRATAAVS